MLGYFKIREQPFGETPNPAYWYASATHREALASVLYGVKAGRGFVALIASPGMGKTTLLFNGLTRLGDTYKTAFLFQAITTPEELLQALFADLGIQVCEQNLVQLQAKLNAVLVEFAQAGKQLLVVMDEAQNLPPRVLEFIRMLSNFETPRAKLIQVVLSGQPQLSARLQEPEMLQLRQRISIFAKLEPLDANEAIRYVEHRLRISGYPPDRSLFTEKALAMIASESGGIPRNINNLCFNAMSLAFATQQTEIGTGIMREAISDLRLEIPGAARAVGLASASNPPPEIEDKKGLPVDEVRSRKKISSPRIVVAADACLAVIALALLFKPGILRERFAIFPQAGSNVSVAPSAASVEAAPPAAKQGDYVLPSTSSVAVANGQTVYKICEARFRSCSPQIIDAIRRLNPQIDDLNQVVAGQTIQLPNSLVAMQPDSTLAEQPDTASVRKEGSP